MGSYGSLHHGMGMGPYIMVWVAMGPYIMVWVARGPYIMVPYYRAYVF